MNVAVRRATNGDRKAIIGIIIAAFGEAEGRVVADLVVDLLADPSAQPLVSLVATVEKSIVGYILYTKVGVDGSDQSVRASILAPLAVHPEHQNKGIGGRLITDGLELLKHAGVNLVFVLGHPGYYPKFDFSPAGIKGLSAPYPIAPENADAWMVRELEPGVLMRVSGKVICSNALMDPRYWIE